MSKSDAFENAVLLMSTGQAHGLTLPITPYIALFTVAPSDSGGGTEVSGGGYARVNASGKFPSSITTPGEIANNASIVFPTPTANWGTIVAYGIYTAATGGTLLRWEALQSQKPVTVDDAPQFPAGKIRLIES